MLEQQRIMTWSRSFGACCLLISPSLCRLLPWPACCIFSPRPSEPLGMYLEQRQKTSATGRWGCLTRHILTR
jgi:hypothetical protein